MSVSFPITLTVTDSSGNTVGTTQITQDIADELYTYYIQKLQSDTQSLEAIVNAVVNDETAFDTLYEKIKEKLLNDVLVVQVKAPPCAQGGQGSIPNASTFAQVYQLINALLPLQLLAAIGNYGSTTDRLLESLLPLLIIVPLFGKLLG